MKFVRSAILLTIALISLHSALLSQTVPSFDLDAYKNFLASHSTMTGEQVLALHPSGMFLSEARVRLDSVKYLDSINSHYGLTSVEKALLGKHSFMVTERVRPNSFADGFLKVWDNDLPVFISSDAILHALHMSWDAILMDVETNVLTKKLDTLLSRLHNQLPLTSVKYASDSAMSRMVNDVDIYLTVPRILLGKTTAPHYPENTETVQTLLDFIKNEQPESYALFSDSTRLIDFSQFTVRGHYTQTAELSKYFKAMMWLGRMEIYLISPKSYDAHQSPRDIQRQIIDAVLMKEIADESGAFPLLNDIDTTLHFFIGDADNVTLPNIKSLLDDLKITRADQLLDTSVVSAFQDTLVQKSFSFQRITSQMLMADPLEVYEVRPASAFLLLGQRFIIDSYTTGNVVYDKIVYEGERIRRMLPSSLDVLYALGNDASAQFLKSDLDQYHYGPNLSALRYLIDSYEPGFWQNSIYSGWLNSIRSLNPPATRTAFPAFMQTASWWQQKMNTQLASWAQLRHDFILYAKQSYTPIPLCSYPAAYVEPVPQFFGAVKSLATNAAGIFQRPPLSRTDIARYFSGLACVADTLGIVAQKELDGTPLLESEKSFLKSMLFRQSMCGEQVTGWYCDLYYRASEYLQKKDLVVADFHTSPANAGGAIVGWVLHAGTGPLNLAVIIANQPGDVPTAFVGPVLSYYEHLSTNFKRLTDEEWQTLYNIEPSLRPAFVNIYLADTTGGSLGDGPSLITTEVNRLKDPSTLPTNIVLGQNFPNPFNSSTVISFSIPAVLGNSDVELVLYDIQGRMVKRLLSQKLPAGNFTTRWDGTSEGGNAVASGVYFYHLVVGNQRQVGKMSFVK